MAGIPSRSHRYRLAWDTPTRSASSYWVRPAARRHAFNWAPASLGVFFCACGFRCIVWGLSQLEIFFARAFFLLKGLHLGRNIISGPGGCHMPGTCQKCGADISRGGGLSTNGGVEMCEPCFLLYAPDQAVGVRLNPPAPTRPPAPAGSTAPARPAQLWLGLTLGLVLLGPAVVGRSDLAGVALGAAAGGLVGLAVGAGMLVYRALNRD